jgi:hypothetical protein
MDTQTVLPEPSGSALFDLGTICTTPAALLSVPSMEMAAALRRHRECDWGNLGEDDKRANNQALKHGERLLSAYETASGTKFWIITEANRSITTILLPEDY